MSAARARTEGFEEPWSRLEAAVQAACARTAGWPAKVVAGLYAALDFLIADEEASDYFLIERWSSGPEDQRRYSLGIDRFAELLRDGAPEPCLISTDRALLYSAATLIAGHLRSGRRQALVAIAPDLVELVLLPYLGFTEAKGWAERTMWPAE
jgi:hypothetical protein